MPNGQIPQGWVDDTTQELGGIALQAGDTYEYANIHLNVGNPEACIVGLNSDYYLTMPGHKAFKSSSLLMNYIFHCRAKGPGHACLGWDGAEETGYYQVKTFAKFYSFPAGANEEQPCNFFLQQVTECPSCFELVERQFAAHSEKGVCYQCLLPRTHKCLFCNFRSTKRSILRITYEGMPAWAHTECIANSSEYICQTLGHPYLYITSDEGGCKLHGEKSVIKEYNYKPIPIFLSLGDEPDLGKKFYGVEIEVEMKRKFSGLTKAISSRFDKDVKGIAYLKKDSSLACNKLDNAVLEGFEIVTHPGTFEWWEAENNPLFPALSKLSVTCESWASENCGMHIHVSKKAFLSKSTGDRSSYIGALTGFILLIGNNPGFCAVVGDRYQSAQAGSFNVLGEYAYQIASGEKVIDRHAAVNVNNKDTVEVRFFRGNLKRERILKNIEFVDSAVAFSVENAYKEIGQNPLELYKEYLVENRDKYKFLTEYLVSKKELSV